MFARRILTLVVSILTVVAVGSPAHAVDTVVAWPPGSIYAPASPSVAIATSTGTLSALNLDIAYHNVMALVTLDNNGKCTSGCGVDTNPWCGPRDPNQPNDRRFPIGQCPSFYSYLGGLGSLNPVFGVNTLTPGQVYTFRCEPHAWMTGTLVVLPL